MSNQMKSFLGKGWSFPPVFDKMSLGVRMEENDADIESSIRIILNTYPGERLMQPDFGCSLKRMNFQNFDKGTLVQIADIVGMSLLFFEPRIKFENVELVEHDIEAGIVVLRLVYKVIITNTRTNIVFPYYILEGTNLQ
jgi:phage baseplate assembly protein W